MNTRFVTGELPIVRQEVAHAPSARVDDLFTRPLVLNTLPQVDNAFSQTPGDPYRLSASGTDYFRAAQTLMHGRLWEQAQKTGIIESHPEMVEFIQAEIDIQHLRRCEASDRATERLAGHLFANGIETVDSDTADLIWRYRTGQIQPSEAALLLMQFPVMESVEAAKRTAPFRTESIAELDNYATREFLYLRQRLLKLGIDADIIFYGPEEGNLESIRQFSDDGSTCMVVAKQAIGEIKAEGYPSIQLKGKKAKVGVSPEIELGDLVPDIKLVGKAPYNLQFVGGSYYFCVKDSDKSEAGAA